MIKSGTEKGRYAGTVPHVISIKAVTAWQVQNDILMGPEETADLKERIAELLIEFRSAGDPVRLRTFLTHRDITLELADIVEHFVEEFFRKSDILKSLKTSRPNNPLSTRRLK